MESFSRNPVSFMLPTFVAPIFLLVTIGASVGVLLLAFLFLTAFGIDSESMLIVMGILGAIMFLVNWVFASGYCGALVNEYYRALRKESVGIVSFMNYAFAHAPKFFVIVLVKAVIIGFFLTPLALIYYFLDLGSVHEAILYVFGGLALILIFIIEFLFSFSFIAYVEKRVKPFSAILISLNFIKDTHVKALLVYVLYCIVCMSLLVPLLNIIMYFVFYPIAASAMIRFFERQSEHYY